MSEVSADTFPDLTEDDIKIIVEEFTADPKATHVVFTRVAPIWVLMTLNASGYIVGTVQGSRPP